MAPAIPNVDPLHKTLLCDLYDDVV
jgi:hypothetical protein